MIEIDSRRPGELQLIRDICAAHDIDPANMIADASCDLLECGRRINVILASREASKLRIYSTVRH